MSQQKYVSDRLLEMSARRPWSFDGPGGTHDEPAPGSAGQLSAESEKDILDRVIAMSLREQQHQQHERIAEPTNELGHNSLNDDYEASRVEAWLEQGLGQRINRVHETLNRQPVDPNQISDLPFEEQLKLVTEMSKAEVSRDVVTLDDTEEELAQALALSLDPDEQKSEDVKDLLKAVEVSKHEQSAPAGYNEASLYDGGAAATASIGGAVGGATATSSSDTNLVTSDERYEESFDNDEVNRVIEQSRREHIQSKLIEDQKIKDELKKFDQIPGETRPIIIDGSNVACAHGCHKSFNASGMIICWNYFKERGHKDVEIYGVTKHKLPMLPEERVKHEQMIESGMIKVVSPGHYDDLFVLKTAQVKGGIVVSNDRFRDVLETHPELESTIRTRVLNFQFSGDTFIPAQDPMGRFGPKLEEYLKF